MSSDISFTVYKGSKSGAIEKATTTKSQLKGDQVHLKVTASGVCGTDLHYQKAGIALGHEGVGVVQSVGPDVKHLKAGDRVGWGYEHSSCGQCQQCLKGTETFCPERAMYGMADTDQGSFAAEAVWHEAFLFKIPDDLKDEDAAPLMCGGATVFQALHGYDTQPTERVGIIGVGGLGHLAIQFAAKMGCEVVVFSGSPAKKEEALKLGAKEFHALKEEKNLKDTTKPIDRLLVTTSAQPDWSQYVPILAPGATVFPLSVAEGNFEFPYMALLLAGITIQGSVVAPRHVHQRMLLFAARHNIKPIIQKFEMSEAGITDAMKKLDEGNVRYRAVLVPKANL
ncbi:NADP-dependent alcohol dehydrogenase-like protein 2 [Elsinoe australis]|uniref:NADP-dependent alcohol dehydrogenase 7 n=1 Tax=Elsinoe australis TaxID=40998 RepID=A0A2P8ADZ8_9PEZI|nr:NADP-dependent alcohol dehydrogenase 7 [Elsinoe australis]TKX20916.1 NADP-dependent alcohol dehydrogenase-like protein 2 [Elsinoe australis]